METGKLPASTHYACREIAGKLAAAEARIAELEKQVNIYTDLHKDATKAAADYYERITALEKALERIKARAEAYIAAEAPMQPESSVAAIERICAEALLKEQD